MLRVLGKSTSINVRKVLWTCAELDLRFEHVESDAQLLAQNPNALVPVIQDGDFVLWESNAICRYLAARQPRGTLLPEDPAGRAPRRCCRPPNGQNSAAGAAPPPTCAWTTEAHTTAVPPSAAVYG